jgi:hypothetical protein
MANNQLVNFNNMITNIKYSNIQKNRNYSLINFYNCDVSDPMQKFWLLIPNSKLIKIVNNELIITISNNDTKIINYMKKLDEIIEEKLQNIVSKNIDLSYSLVTNKNHDPMLLLKTNINTKYSDSNNNQTNLNNFTKNSKVKLLIELESVIIENNKAKQIWKLIMMKEEKIELTFDIFNQTNTNITNSNQFNSNQFNSNQFNSNRTNLNQSNKKININRPPHPLALALAGAKSKLKSSSNLNSKSNNKISNNKISNTSSGGISVDMLKSIKLRKSKPKIIEEKKESGIVNELGNAIKNLKKTNNVENIELKKDVKYIIQKCYNIKSKLKMINDKIKKFKRDFKSPSQYKEYC